MLRGTRVSTSSCAIAKIVRRPYRRVDRRLRGRRRDRSPFVGDQRNPAAACRARPRRSVHLPDTSAIPVTLDRPHAYRGRAEPFAGRADYESVAADRKC